MTYPEGYDVSHWQSLSDWSAARIAFIFIKASEGTTPDPMYQSHLAKAKGSGLLIGAYMFARSDLDLDTQAAYFVTKAGPDAKALVVDDEGIHATNAANTRILIEAIRRRDPYHRQIGLYMSESVYHENVGQDFDWIAHYGVTRPGQPWDFHQYTSTPIDRDHFNGTIEQLRAIFTPKEAVIVGTSFTPSVSEDGVATFKAPGNLIDTSTNVLTPVPKGYVRNTASSVVIKDGPYAGSPAYLATLGGRSQLILATAVTYKANPTAPVDCTIPVQEAVEKQKAADKVILDLAVSAASGVASTAERERLAQAEADRIRST